VDFQWQGEMNRDCSRGNHREARVGFRLARSPLIIPAAAEGSRRVCGVQERTSESAARRIEAESTKAGEHHAKWSIVDT